MDNDFDFCDSYDHDPFERHDDYNVFEENCLAAESHDDFFDEANDFEEEYDEEYA